MKSLNRKQKRSLLNKVVLGVAIVEPLMALPQVYEIYANKSAANVSILSWALYAFTALVWLLYGVALRDKPLVITSILNVFAELAVVIAIAIY